MSNFIYSTITAQQNYAVFTSTEGGGSVKVRDIFINGGHGLTNRHGELLTGAVTEVDDETLSVLRQNPTFLAHVKDGWLLVDTKKKEVEVAISDLNLRDGSSPITQPDMDALYDDGVLPVPVEAYSAEGKPRARARAKAE